jgi:predicted histone-like DNA-binding protein
MAVFYNKVQRANPARRDETKWYATLKRISMVKEKEVAKQISDETTINRKEAEIALAQFEKILIRELMNGNSVQLGDWGSFYLTCKSEGKDTKEEVNAGSIQKVNIRFVAGKSLKEALQNVSFKDIDSMAGPKLIDR